MSRNKLLNSIAIGMIAVSLAIFGIFLLIYVNLNSVARHWTDSVQIIAYFHDPLTNDQSLQIDAKIREIPYIEEVTYISQDDALKKFEERLVGHEQLLEGLADSNPLPASFEIRVKRKYRDLAGVQKVVKRLQEKLPSVNDIQYGQKWLENLTTVINMLRFIGVFLGIFLFLTVIFIISNTIKLALYTREEELNIMKFVGATEAFIKGPFLAEGIIRGFSGSVLSLFILFLVHKLFTTIIHYSSSSLFTFSSISFLSMTAMINIILLGSFLGWCGSLLTLHKFLKTY
jgi:cell division transport system permease protein